ncbi:hypothetical protein CDL15_Pgr024957 [Punica granatum]|uniref:Uncharacterized protein n=1 Tax=Punica granatum TaxID=22663 RepID=A0A218W8W9_PUNGR|nr:hypothetical protein CDL15_Pgr024957 [Punica granatum]
MEEQEQQRGRSCSVVLVPYPFHGLVTPMFSLGGALHSKGFSITIAHTQFSFPDQSNFPNFSFISLPASFSEDELSSRDFAALVASLDMRYEGPFLESLSQFKDLPLFGMVDLESLLQLIRQSIG